MTVRGRTAVRRRETRVLVAGCQGFSEALRPSLTTDDRFALVGSAANADDAVTMSTIFEPDLVLVEPDMSQVVPQLSVASAAVIVLPVDSDDAEVEVQAGHEDQDLADGSLAILGVVLALASLGSDKTVPLEISLN
jgi:DNA-binding NarL/FixJ family response regulator